MRSADSSRGPRLAGALLLASTLVSCGQAIITAPVGSTLVISINPPFIAAQGDTAVVSVFVLEPAGTPVPDGTVVQFFTTLGRIPEQGKTNDGVARVNLTSDSRSGTAKVTAFSGAATSSSDVIIGAKRPARVVAALIDARINLSLGQSIGRFKATVLDADGNPVSGIPVRFSVVDNLPPSPPGLDAILDGSDRFTDNNGDAQSRVQTKRQVAGTIRLRAEVLSAPFSGSSVEFTLPVVE